METKKRAVYIGNGETIHVDENENFSFYLDLNKLQKIVDENPGKSIYVGATGDWFFTARSITADNLKEFNEYKAYILRSSCWSRFSVEIDDEMQDCTVEIPKNMDELAFKNGYALGFGKVNFWIPNMYQRMSVLGYEKIKRFSEEVETLLKKYEDDNGVKNATI